jgi:hypothetical protein
MTAVGEELVGLKQSREGKESVDEGPKAIQKPLKARLDRAYLCFCISILDHTLKGDLFESAAVEFLAALAVDSKKKNPSRCIFFHILLIRFCQDITDSRHSDVSHDGRRRAN